LVDRLLLCPKWLSLSLQQIVRSRPNSAADCPARRSRNRTFRISVRRRLRARCGRHGPNERRPRPAIGV